MAWPFKVLQQAAGRSRNVARTCRHLGFRGSRSTAGNGDTRLTVNPEAPYQFTAIDDCTNIRELNVYDARNRRTAIQFMKALRGVGRPPRVQLHHGDRT